MRDTQGHGVSRFLSLATDEGESQAVSGPCVSFVWELGECETLTRWSSQFGTLLFKCIGPRVESEMHEHDRYP